jgi:hypothetical protein
MKFNIKNKICFFRNLALINLPILCIAFKKKIDSANLSPNKRLFGHKICPVLLKVRSIDAEVTGTARILRAKDASIRKLAAIRFPKF